MPLVTFLSPNEKSTSQERKIQVHPKKSLNKQPAPSTGDAAAQDFSDKKHAKIKPHKKSYDKLANRKKRELASPQSQSPPTSTTKSINTFVNTIVETGSSNSIQHPPKSPRNNSPSLSNSKTHSSKKHSISNQKSAVDKQTSGKNSAKKEKIDFDKLMKEVGKIHHIDTDEEEDDEWRQELTFFIHVNRSVLEMLSSCRGGGDSTKIC